MGVIDFAGSGNVHMTGKFSLGALHRHQHYSRLPCEHEGKAADLMLLLLRYTVDAKAW